MDGFQAPPPVGRKEGFSFLVYGDMGDPAHRKAKAPGCALWVTVPAASDHACSEVAVRQSVTCCLRGRGQARALELALWCSQSMV